MQGGYRFGFNGTQLVALPSGALWWAERRLLAVSDLHFGKSERLARRGGALIPPYEVADTLLRLEADIEATAAACVVCVGDAFDDLAVELPAAETLWLARLMAGRRWIWIAGNHDPAPMAVGGSHRAELRLGPLTFRHIAAADPRGEVSGHYHPKLRVAGQSRRCFLLGRDRLILPAYGTYAGGLASSDPVLGGLMDDGAIAVLTGTACLPVPLRRGQA
jgi:DNA ligase-associated metallophosphoesterase